jgi:reactive intermediate/imine deaminase
VIEYRELVEDSVSEEELLMRQIVQSPEVPTPKTAYSQAVLAEGSRVLYISGQVPVDRDGQLVGTGDFRAQTHQVFANLTAQLQAAGADWSQVVKLTVLMTDIANFPIFNEVRQEYLQAPFPAATTAAVSALVAPEWLIEIEATAVLD